MDNCRDCKFYKPYDNMPYESQKGQCRRNTPDNWTKDLSHFEWCGEFVSKEAPTPFRGEVSISKEEGEEFLKPFLKYSMTPGCDEAVNNYGCSCPVEQTKYATFVTSDDCPLHGNDSHLKG